jgi:hypothetical protein
MKEKKYKKASEALAAAKALIGNKKRWIQGYLAARRIKPDVVKSCPTKSKHAEAFCALGAVKRVNGPAERAATAFLREAATAMLRKRGAHYDDSQLRDIFEINDSEKGRAYASVMAMFKRAIRQAKLAGN